jgi:hypothetical protein
MPISISGQSLASSNLSEIPSGQSFTDRLKIELPSFETSAPLPSVPATPQLSVDTADEDQGGGPSQLSGMSESELSSGGERSSILKTLTGLWAFRAGEITPLVYPLSANDHIFADSRVIIRENEPTSIIAFTLNSKLYRDKMKNATYAQSVRSEAFMPEEGTADRASTWDVVSLDEAMDADDPYRREGGTHLQYGTSPNEGRADRQTLTLARPTSSAESFSPSNSPLCARHVSAKIALLNLWRVVCNSTHPAANRARHSLKPRTIDSSARSYPDWRWMR